VEVFLAIIFIAVVVLIKFWRSISSPPEPPRPPTTPSGQSLFDAPAQSRAMQPRSASKDSYRPPAPSCEPIEAWGLCSPYEVVGEFYYGDNIARLFQGVPGFRTEGGAELQIPATLVAAPDNPHGAGHAIAVWMGGQHVGYIASEDAAMHFPDVMRLRVRGEEVALDGRLWARRDGTRVYARATIWLPAPGDYEAPMEFLPDGPYVVLPTGGRIQVTREDEHMDAIVPHLVPDGARSIAVTLHAITEIRPRSAVDAIEVRLQGERVGILTPTQTANVKPLVEYVEQRGSEAVARATLVGNQIKADVTLHLSKAQDVDQGWLDALGEPGRTSARGRDWDDA
jgi:hypothetical protein